VQRVKGKHFAGPVIAWDDILRNKSVRSIFNSSRRLPVRFAKQVLLANIAPGLQAHVPIR
jgi:hypothetical protein